MKIQSCQGRKFYFHNKCLRDMMAIANGRNLLPPQAVGINKRVEK